MDKSPSDHVMEFWKKVHFPQLQELNKYKLDEQFHQVVNMCVPGFSFYYILNHSDFSFEYIHPDVENVLGVNQKNATINSLQKLILPSEIVLIKKKEKIIFEFLRSVKDQNDLLSYKIIYSYRCKSLSGKIQTMIYQSTGLSLSETGNLEYSFVMHSDISHMGNLSTDWVSFISINGKDSFLNIKTDQSHFYPKPTKQKKSFDTCELTKRELEIVKLISQGLNAKAISEKLFISFNTTRTHRKNLLLKTHCSNTAELVTKCLANGTI